MRSVHLRRVAALTFALAMALSACSGGSGSNASDPVGVVQAAYAAVSSGGIAKATEFACAAKKDDIAKAFGGAGLDNLAAAGVDPDEFLAAMTLSFANLTVTQTAKTDTTATVTVTGDSSVKVDKDKMRAVMKTILTTQGKPTDDATLDTVMNAVMTQFEQPRKMNDTVELVNEGGKWLICG